MTDDQENGLTASMGSSTAVKQDEDFDSEATINTSVSSATEEIFHTYQHALGQAHPTIFGEFRAASCSLSLKMTHYRLFDNESVTLSIFTSSVTAYQR